MAEPTLAVRLEIRRLTYTSLEAQLMKVIEDPPEKPVVRLKKVLLRYPCVAISIPLHPEAVIKRLGQHLGIHRQCGWQHTLDVLPGE